MVDDSDSSEFDSEDNDDKYFSDDDDEEDHEMEYDINVFYYLLMIYNFINLIYIIL